MFKCLKRRAKIRAFLLLTAFAVASLFSACASPISESSRHRPSTDDGWSSNAKEINMLCAGGVQAVKDAMLTFEENTGIKVNLTEIAFSDLPTKMLSQFAAGNVDYDITLTWNATVAQWGSAGYLEDITDRVSKELKDDLNPLVNDVSYFNGRLYAIPRLLSFQMMWYNKAMFKDAGLDPEKPPKTWEEFKDACTKLTRDTNKDGTPDTYALTMPFGSQFGVLNPYSMALFLNGGDWFDADYNLLFDNEAGLAAVKQWRELFDMGVMNPDVVSIPDNWTNMQAFAQGNAAICFAWPNTYMHCQNPEISAMKKEDISWSTIPAVSKKTATVCGSESYAITAASKRKDSALKFIEYIASVEVQEAIAKQSFFPPVRMSMATNSTVLEVMPFLDTVNEQGKGFSGSLAAPFTDEIQDKFMSKIAEAYTGKMDPEQAFSEGITEVKKIVETYKAAKK
ncbi:MAG: extracellular solute-binding protein [Saccharofermentanales bacterium]|jgi:multiple sugar transport system substrate-binding protein